MCVAHEPTLHLSRVSHWLLHRWLAEFRFSHGTGPLFLSLSTDIDGLINIVPPKFYFPPDPDEMARKFQKYTGKVQKAPKHERKMAKVERKRAALDPDQPNTSEVIAADDNDDSDDNDDDDSDDDEEEAPPAKKGKGGGKPQQPQKQQPKQPPPAAQRPAADGGEAGSSSSSGPAATSKPPPPALDAAGRLEGTLDCGLSVDGLRQRLAERLQQLRGKRGGTAKAPGERQADAKSKAKQKKHVSGMKKQSGEGGGKGGGKGGGANGGSGDADSAPASKAGGAQSIEFNKLAAAAAQPGKTGKRKMSTAELLAQAEEAERKKRNRLSQPDGGGEDAQIGEWQRALQKAGGIKQKDNPTLLRKALKRQQRDKKKSSKDWASRLKTVAKSMTDKQEKRKANLADRKTKNKSKAAKHKAARAGFEGKRNSFLS